MLLALLGCPYCNIKSDVVDFSETLQAVTSSLLGSPVQPVILVSLSTMTVPLVTPQNSWTSASMSVGVVCNASSYTESNAHFSVDDKSS